MSDKIKFCWKCFCWRVVLHFEGQTVSHENITWYCWHLSCGHKVEKTIEHPGGWGN